MPFGIGNDTGELDAPELHVLPVHVPITHISSLLPPFSFGRGDVIDPSIDRQGKETRREEIKKDVDQTKRVLSEEEPKYQNELNPLREALLARYDQLHHLRVQCVELETKLLAHRIVVLMGREEQKAAHDRILDEEIARLQLGPLPHMGYLDILLMKFRLRNRRPFVT